MLQNPYFERRWRIIMRISLILGIPILILFAVIKPFLLVNTINKHLNIIKGDSTANNKVTASKDNVQPKFINGKEISLPLKWRTQVGLTTFRSTISFANGKIIVGSNGDSRSSLNNSDDGVYLIDSKTGAIVRQIRNEIAGDSDINGVAIYQNSLFFGSDNNYVFSYDFNGTKNWTFETDGDVEGAPTLTDITGDAFPDVVFASENGTVYALNGESGKLIWRFQNQMEQAPGKYEYLSSKAFMSSPAVLDLNQDGVRDVLIGGRNAIFYALDGKTGSIIWQYHTGSGIHSSAMVANVKGNLRIIFAESYSGIYILNINGKLQDKQELNAYSGGIQGLFSSPIYTPWGKVAIGSSWWDNEDDGFWIVPFGLEKSEQQSSLFLGENSISASPLVADVLGEKEPQIVIATENGKLILSNEQGYTMATMSLPAGVEATPLIADIDEDGQNELLIAANDGYVYCYETNGSGFIYWGQFRGNNSNTGVL